jgi:signal transduction histidine kinase
MDVGSPPAERSDAPTGFVAVAAHELRAPATVVHGIAATLDSRGGDLGGEELSALHGLLHAQTSRLVDLIDQLLDLSRLDCGAVLIEHERFAVRERLAWLVDSIAGDRRDEITIAVDPELETVVDPRAFDRIVSNLVANALRHGAAPVRVDAEQAGRCLRVTVEDAGVGVAPEFRDRLFDRFSRDDPSGERGGAGLGLSIARQYATAHGGSIVYEDAAGHGARFRVDLPTARTPGLPEALLQ